MTEQGTVKTHTIPNQYGDRGTYILESPTPVVEITEFDNVKLALQAEYSTSSGTK